MTDRNNSVVYFGAGQHWYSPTAWVENGSQVYVNEYQAGGVETPLGGYKQSGYGRELGVEGLDAYLQQKSVVMDISQE